MLQFRLQKIMDEYVAGVATYYNTNDKMLEVAEQKLEMLKEDAMKMRAKDCTNCCAPGKLPPYSHGGSPHEAHPVP